MSTYPLQLSLKQSFIRWADALPPKLFAQVFNAVQALRRRSPRIVGTQEAPLTFEIHGAGTSIRTFARDRTWYYGPGVEVRLNALARSYGIDLVDLAPGDIFIDCGANIGELGLWARPRQVEYVPLEPDPTPGRLLAMNLPGQSVKAMCLWKEVGKLTFYKKSNTADSSAIEVGDYTDRIDVEATTLDNLIESLGSRPVKLLKVEAEGAEPEVLQGLNAKAAMIKYISVDVGYERGVSADNTACPAFNRLFELGFKLKHANIRQAKFLFENGRFGSLAN
jgi:FkbM family methyltransferase